MIADDYDETSQEARHWQTTILDSLDMLLKIFFWKKFLHILTFYGKKFVWKNLEFMSKEDYDENEVMKKLGIGRQPPLTSYRKRK